MRLGLFWSLLQTGLILLFSVTCSSQVRPTSFTERYVDKDQVPVSGAVVVGAQFESSGRAGTELVTVLPQVHGTHLCVTLMSVDGRYWAFGEYNLEQAGSRKVTLTLPSKYKMVLEGLQANEVAAVGQLETNCEAASSRSEWILLAWNETDLGSRRVLFVNSGGYDVRIFDSDAKTYEACPRISTGNRSGIAFDTSCGLSSRDIPLWKGAIVRNDFERQLPDILLRIWIN